MGEVVQFIGRAGAQAPVSHSTPRPHGSAMPKPRRIREPESLRYEDRGGKVELAIRISKALVEAVLGGISYARGIDDWHGVVPGLPRDPEREAERVEEWRRKAEHHAARAVVLAQQLAETPARSLEAIYAKVAAVREIEARDEIGADKKQALTRAVLRSVHVDIGALFIEASP